ncbi:MAG: hypothetical protein IPF54_05835 [Draconibacterium sp.]|nr:hypothetical protein [Draconibacterium sp.]
MIKHLKITFLFLIVFGTLSGQDKKEWEDPAVFNINRTAPHANFIPFENERLALENNANQSAYFQSLNGIWKFNIASNPENRPVDFYKHDFDVSTWPDIKVPGNWERQGFDTAINKKPGCFWIARFFLYHTNFSTLHPFRKL